MKNQNELITMSLLGILALVPQASFAWGGHRDCVQEDWTLLDTTYSSEGSCQVQDPLELQSVQHIYPLMKENPYTVNYWHVSYSKDLVETQTYLREVIDYCHGRVLSSEKIPATTHVSKDFVFDESDNPNLSDKIDASYDLSAMTPGEADEAAQKLKDSCEQYQPGPEDFQENGALD